MATSTDSHYGRYYPLVAPLWPISKPKKINHSANIHGILLVPNETNVIEPWIYEHRPRPRFPDLPDEVHERIGSFCLDPHDLLSLSSTCTKLANLLRTVECWLDHHWGRGYDIGILRRKAREVAMSKPEEYGVSGWGLLVKSARDKWQFSDFSLERQLLLFDKPLPHTLLEIDWKNGGFIGENPIDKYQENGERCIQVMYDIVTEHENRNFLLYPDLYNDALALVLRKGQPKYLQALIAAAHLFNGQWQLYKGVCTSDISVSYAKSRMKDLEQYSRASKTTVGSLAYSLLCGVTLMQADSDDPYVYDFMDYRRLYPHTPLGPAMWWNDQGTIDPKGLAWAVKTRSVWKGRVDCMGSFSTIRQSSALCSIDRAKIARSVTRMRLEFSLNGTIAGRGADFGGKYRITGEYRSSYVNLKKEYLLEEQPEEDHDVYICVGQMLPWGIFGQWRREEDELKKEIVGYFGLWKFEGAPKIWPPAEHSTEEGTYIFRPKPYSVDPDWFDQFEWNYDHKKPSARGWVFFEHELPGFDDIETEYENEVDEVGNIRRVKKQKYKIVYLG